jgi:hypothetical protein
MMRPATFFRLSLLGPLLLPLLGAVTPILPLQVPALILSVGILYYGPGYVVFALGVLFWLRAPRTPDALFKAALLGPVVAAPLIALSVIAVSLLVHTDRLANAPLAALLWGTATLVLGYGYVLPLLAVARLLNLNPDDSVPHAA